MSISYGLSWNPIFSKRLVSSLEVKDIAWEFKGKEISSEIIFPVFKRKKEMAAQKLPRKD